MVCPNFAGFPFEDDLLCYLIVPGTGGREEEAVHFKKSVVLSWGEEITCKKQPRSKVYSPILQTRNNMKENDKYPYVH